VLKNASGSSNHFSDSNDNEHLFTPQAIQLIFKRSGGIPRIITTIMEQALIYGSAQKLNTIDDEVIYKIEPEL
jgi:type II secretory pathway predicted ATPase ExeA